MNRVSSGRIGRRTGVKVLDGKVVRKNTDGTDNYDDYWTDESFDGSEDSDESISQQESTLPFRNLSGGSDEGGSAHLPHPLITRKTGYTFSTPRNLPASSHESASNVANKQQKRFSTRSMQTSVKKKHKPADSSKRLSVLGKSKLDRSKLQSSPSDKLSTDGFGDSLLDKRHVNASKSTLPKNQRTLNTTEDAGDEARSSFRERSFHDEESMDTTLDKSRKEVSRRRLSQKQSSSKKFERKDVGMQSSLQEKTFFDKSINTTLNNSEKDVSRHQSLRKQLSNITNSKKDVGMQSSLQEKTFFDKSLNTTLNSSKKDVSRRQSLKNRLTLNVTEKQSVGMQSSFQEKTFFDKSVNTTLNSSEKNVSKQQSPRSTLNVTNKQSVGMQSSIQDETSFNKSVNTSHNSSEKDVLRGQLPRKRLTLNVTDKQSVGMQSSIREKTSFNKSINTSLDSSEKDVSRRQSPRKRLNTTDKQSIGMQSSLQEKTSFNKSINTTLNSSEKDVSRRQSPRKRLNTTDKQRVGMQSSIQEKTSFNKSINTTLNSSEKDVSRRQSPRKRLTFNMTEKQSIGKQNSLEERTIVNNSINVSPVLQSGFQFQNDEHNASGDKTGRRKQIKRQLDFETPQTSNISTSFPTLMQTSVEMKNKEVSEHRVARRKKSNMNDNSIHNSCHIGESNAMQDGELVSPLSPSGKGEVASGREPEERRAGSESEQEERLAGSEREQEERMAGSESEQEEWLAGSESQQEERLADSESETEERMAGTESQPEDRLAGSGSEQEERLAGSESETEERMAGTESQPEDRLAGSESEQEERLAGSESEPEDRLAGSESETEERMAGSGRKGSKNTLTANHENNLRRSTRCRRPPLDHWRCERVRYMWNKGEIVTIGHDPGTKADLKALDKIKRKTQAKKAKSKRRKIRANVETVPSNFPVPLDVADSATVDPVYIPFQELDWNVPPSTNQKKPDYKVCHSLFSEELSFGFTEIAVGCSKGVQYSPNTNLYFVIQRGEVLFFVKGNQYKLKKNDVILVPFKTPYSIENKGKTKALLHFTSTELPLSKC